MDNYLFLTLCIINSCNIVNFIWTFLYIIIVQTSGQYHKLESQKCNSSKYMIFLKVLDKGFKTSFQHIVLICNLPPTTLNHPPHPTVFYESSKDMLGSNPSSIILGKLFDLTKAQFSHL